MLLENDPMTWVSFAIRGTGPNTKLALDVTEQGITVTLDQIDWSGKTDAYLRLDRSGGSISAYYSDDGLSWVLVRTFVPVLPYMDNLRLGLCVFWARAP